MILLKMHANFNEEINRSVGGQGSETVVDEGWDGEREYQQETGASSADFATTTQRPPPPSGPPPPPPVVRRHQYNSPAADPSGSSSSHAAHHYFHPYYYPAAASSSHASSSNYRPFSTDSFPATAGRYNFVNNTEQQPTGGDSISFYSGNKSRGHPVSRGDQAGGRKRHNSFYGGGGAASSSASGNDVDTAYSSASSYYGRGGAGHNSNRKNPHYQNDDMANEGDHNNRAGGDAGYGSTTIRLLMQGKEVGSIIGKEGRTIKRIRDDSNCRINISDSSAPERIVTLLGTMPTVLKAFSLICQKFDEDSRQHNGSSGGREHSASNGDEAGEDAAAGGDAAHAGRSNAQPLTIRLLVPSSQCGSIIGKGGEKIKYIRESTGVSIQVNTDVLPNSTERCVTVSGSVDSVCKCFDQVVRLMNDSPPKGPVIQYRPLSASGGGGGGNGNKNGIHNGGSSHAQQQQLQLSHAAASILNQAAAAGNGAGGFSPSQSAQLVAAAAQQLLGPAFPNHHAHHPSHHSANNIYGVNHHLSPHAAAAAAAAAVAAQHHAELAKLHQLQQQLLGPGGGGRHSNGSPHLSNSHSPNGLSGGGGGGGGTSTSSPLAMQPLANGQVQQELTVPNELIGCVIGRGGAKIQEIRNMSGAMIKISPSAGRGQNNDKQQSPGNGEPNSPNAAVSGEHNNGSSKDRVVTISGRPEAVQLAFYMIQNRISQEQANNAASNDGGGHNQQQQQHAALAAFNAAQFASAFSPTLIRH